MRAFSEVRSRGEHLKKMILGLVISLGAGCVSGTSVSRSVDAFTDVKSCRVEYGDEFTRSMNRQLTGSFIGLYFFAENKDGEVRAGVVSEPKIPIGGDVQLRVDDNPMVSITAADTPVDLAPTTSLPAMPGLSAEQQKDMQASLKASMSVASPYRVLVGDKARSLLREMIRGQKVIWRVVGINTATSTTGTIVIRPDLGKSLAECGIDLS